MEKAPNILSPKDCLYIGDILTNTLTVAKKCNLYQEMATDSTVKELIEDMRVLLTAQYEDLVGILEDEGNE
ncbi:TPA: hypothetical protein GXZ34_03530 [bacterium]|nr:hypothetical protein [bacterium]